MHLVAYGPKLDHSQFYQKRIGLTRPDSLPYLFRQLRLHRNLTRQSLAKKFGTSEQYVARVELGLIHPSLKFCLQCAKEFEINPLWVKRIYAKEMIERFTNRLKKRLGLED